MGYYNESVEKRIIASSIVISPFLFIAMKSYKKCYYYADMLKMERKTMKLYRKQQSLPYLVLRTDTFRYSDYNTFYHPANYTSLSARISKCNVDTYYNFNLDLGEKTKHIVASDEIVDLMKYHANTGDSWIKKHTFYPIYHNYADITMCYRTFNNEHVVVDMICDGDDKKFVDTVKNLLDVELIKATKWGITGICFAYCTFRFL